MRRRPRVVLDTNVVVSAHLKSEGFERFVLDLAVAGKLQLFVSPEILTEYRGVLARPKFRIARRHLGESMTVIGQSSKLVKPKTRLSVAWDESDDKFLECAEAARADFLVTGNKRHFPRTWGETQIVNARELILLVAPDLQA